VGGSTPAQGPDHASAFYPTSAGQLCDHLQVHSALDRRIPGALTWRQFCRHRISHLCPRWRTGDRPSLKTIVSLWPQHSAITSYFDQGPNGTVCSLHSFTWMIHRYLNLSSVQAWEAAVGITVGSLFVDTPLCLPLCPLRRRMHRCGWDVASVSTSHATPSVYNPLGMEFSVSQQSTQAMPLLFSGPRRYSGPGGHLFESRHGAVCLRMTADQGELLIHWLSPTSSIPGSATPSRHSPATRLRQRGRPSSF